jgi:hypothetical protein
MKRWIDMGAQALLGLIFLVFGLNGFFHFLPMPELPEPAASFMGALMATGYFMVMLKIVEVVAGLLLLIRKLPALALVLLAPIVVNILVFHLFLAPSGLPLALVLVILEAYLGFFVYRDRFRDVLRA